MKCQVPCNSQFSTVCIISYLSYPSDSEIIFVNLMKFCQSPGVVFIVKLRIQCTQQFQTSHPNNAQGRPFLFVVLPLRTNQLLTYPRWFPHKSRCLEWAHVSIPNESMFYKKCHVMIGWALIPQPIRKKLLRFTSQVVQGLGSLKTWLLEPNSILLWRKKENRFRIRS